MESAVTEEEATNKLCCGPRAVEDRSDGSTRRCVGSECMAWRTRHQWLDNAQQQPDWVSYAPYAFEPGPGQERDDGFCGLAGSPA